MSIYDQCLNGPFHGHLTEPYCFIENSKQFVNYFMEIHCLTLFFWVNLEQTNATLPISYIEGTLRRSCPKSQLTDHSVFPSSTEQIQTPLLQILVSKWFNVWFCLYILVFSISEQTDSKNLDRNRSKDPLCRLAWMNCKG